MGRQSLRSVTTASYNVAVGTNALYSNTTGNYNSAAGPYALGNNTVGTENSALGDSALYFNTTGNNNTATGICALCTNTTGSNNTALGTFADVSTSALTNATAIGYQANVDASNKVRVGNTAVTVIGGQVAWSTLSDGRAKKDIQDIPLGLDFIQALRPVAYRLKGGNGRIDLGFVAQDVETVLGDEYNVLNVGGDAERTLSLRHADLMAPMVKAIQEQQQVIDGLRKAREDDREVVGTLRKELNELKEMLAGRSK
jgi:hypothetical protein